MSWALFATGATLAAIGSQAHVRALHESAMAFSVRERRAPWYVRWLPPWRRRWEARERAWCDRRRVLHAAAAQQFAAVAAMTSAVKL